MASKARRILHMTSDAVHASLAAAVLAYTDFKEIPCRFFFLIISKSVLHFCVTNIPYGPKSVQLLEAQLSLRVRL